MWIGPGKTPARTFAQNVDRPIESILAASPAGIRIFVSAMLFTS
jgi:hypothetical protein